MGSTIWTIGYGGVSLESLIDALREAGVSTVVDTRANPWSPRPEMRRSALLQAMNDAGLGYESIPELGAPRSIRDLPFDGSFETAYRAHLATAEPTVSALTARVRREALCFLCAEADTTTCHRSLLANEIARRAECIVTDLQPAAAEVPSVRIAFLSPDATDEQVEAFAARLRR